MIVQRISHCFPIRLFFVGFILLLISLTFSAFADCPPTKPMVIFQSYRKGAWHIYAMDLDGNNIVRQLTNSPWHDARPDWSPDGTKIAFYSGPDLAIMDCDGNNIQKIPTGLFFPEDPDWSSVGTKIVFSARAAPNDIKNDIFVLDLTTETVRNLTNDPNSDESPSWSPDGKWIVFSSNRDPKFWLRDPGGALLAMTSDLYIMDSEGNNVKNLTQSISNEIWPVWSTDGTQIAFVSSSDGFHGQLYIMDTKGGRPHRLTDFKGGVISPSWSPNGQQIIFSAWFFDKGEDIYMINRDGTNLHRITDNVGILDRHPDLFLPRLGISPAGLKTTIWGTIKQKYK